MFIDLFYFYRNRVIKYLIDIYFLGWPESPRCLFFQCPESYGDPKLEKPGSLQSLIFEWLEHSGHSIFWCPERSGHCKKNLHWARHTRDWYHRGKFYIYFYKKSQVPNLKNDWVIDVLDFWVSGVLRSLQKSDMERDIPATVIMGADFISTSITNPKFLTWKMTELLMF